MSETETTPPSVYDHLAAILDQMSAVSWQKLGLQPDMMTGKIAQDIEGAKVAIDLVAHLASILDSQLDANDRRQVQGLVRDLRMNYVQKLKEASE